MEFSKSVWQHIKDARDLFGIKSGDLMLVVGDNDHGIGISKADVSLMKKFALKILEGIGGEKNG